MAHTSPEDFFKSSDPHTILECAKFYAYELGWVLQPIHKAMGFAPDGRLICSCELTGQKWKNCNPEKPGKHPWAGWKQKPMETPEQGFNTFYEYWSQYPNGVNIGIRTGQVSGMWALDMDVGRMKNGIADFEGWLSKNGLGWSDVDTLRATTGGGGTHLIFSYPSDVEKIATVAPHAELGPAVDVKGDGGYILVAPSVHSSGKQYQWNNLLAKPTIRLAPDKLMRTVQGKAKKEAGAVVDSGYTPSLSELKDYADELSRKRTPRAKEIGENMLFALSGSAIAEDGGAHDAYRDIMYVIAKRWSRCDPKEIVKHFEDSVQARFEGKPDASTNIANLLDSMCSALDKVVEEAKSWTGQLHLNDKGQPLDTHTNIYKYLRFHEAWQGVFGYNLRTRKSVFLRAPPTESPPLSNVVDMKDAVLIADWFATRVRMSGQISKNNLLSAITGAALRNSFDPLQQAMQALRGKWDGVSRLDTAFQRAAGVPDDAWARLVGPLWFKSLVARLLWPGCKVDTMLILEGHQGFLKSTFFKALLPDAGYFSDSLFHVNHSTETIRLVHSGPAIFELGELTGLRKQEVDEIKAFLSAQTDDLRALYENYEQSPRRCIFVGSTNLNEYLRDETGGRRFWPLRVTKRIDINLVYAEREQWLAEAVARVEAGEIWWLPDAQAEALAAVEQSSRYEADIWLQPIAEWLHRQPVQVGVPSTATEQMQQQMNKECAGEYVTTHQVALYALKLEMKSARSAEGNRINKILRRLGWIPSHTTINGINQRIWKRPKPGGQPHGGVTA